MRTDDEELVGLTGLIAVILLAALLALSGCATKPPPSTAPTVEDTMKAGVMDGAIAAAKVPLFKMTCAPSCTFASLEIGNPAAAGQMAEIVKVAMTPTPDEMSQNYRATIGALAQVGGWAVIGNYANKLVSNVTQGFASGYASNVAIAGKIPQPGAVSNTTNTLSGTGVLGSGTYTAPITTTTTTTTNPAPKVCTPTYSPTGVPTGFTCN
jgi:hypothetical protein